MQVRSKKIMPTPDTVVQEVGGEIVLLNLDTEYYYGLDQVGVRFWQLISANPALEAAIDQLHAEYSVDRAQLEADIDQLVNVLAEAGLITFSDD